MIPPRAPRASAIPDETCPRVATGGLCPRSHALRGNVGADAPRPERSHGRTAGRGATQSVAGIRSHAERGNEKLNVATGGRRGIVGRAQRVRAMKPVIPPRVLLCADEPAAV